ncbi:tripartite ATP-independent transporter solute receptor, DctP family [Lentibacillus persicus]|uniref:Tripartite ATP-independent transporter solute receptor, DctP family n=1 Tax=Lentibacillus persicus TaxID=640948 RepID=A0A1I1VZZ4_9BACI|nr:TRAP transporter substrate-binding protein [Lentibacillus persicus]SFD88494.1 tripartite ATP-independent transporter solute receptor, DctP family [Lentibacillus persicus]
MFKMNGKIFLFLLSLLAVITLIGCSSDGAASDNNADDSSDVENNSESGTEAESSGEAEITLRLSEPQVDDYPDSIAEKEFAKKVEELSDGRIKIEVYTGGQLGDEKTTIEQTQVGIIDIGRANAGPLTEFAGDFGVFSFPFLFDSREHMWNALDNSLRDKLFANLESADLIGLSIFDAGARSFYTMDPIETIEDIEGKKIRVMQNDILIDAFGKLGTSPTPLAASEVYSGLQTGVIEGGENNVSTYVADGHYEVAENFTLSEHLRIPGVMFMSKDSWDKLSEEDQQIIKDAALEAEKIQLEEYDKYSQEAMDKVVEAGNNVVELTEEERAKFREKVEPLYDEYDSEYGELFQVIENAR